MKHIKLIEDEQLLEQISGGRLSTVKKIKAEVIKVVLALKERFNPKKTTAQLE